jgi:hypothetical protein
MGLGDLLEKTANVLIKFKADTTDLKKGLKDATEEQKKFAQAAIKAADEHNEKIRKIADTMDIAKKGIELTTKSIEFLGDSWKAYERKAMEAGGAEARRAREFRHSLDTWRDGMDRAKAGIGSLVVAFGPLLEALGRTVGFVVDLVRGAVELFSQGDATDPAGRAFQKEANAFLSRSGFGGPSEDMLGGSAGEAIRENQLQAASLGKITVEKFADAWGAGVFRAANEIDLEAWKSEGTKTLDAVMNAFTGGVFGEARRFHQGGGYLRKRGQSGPAQPFDAREALGQGEVDGVRAPLLQSIADERGRAEAAAQRLAPGALGGGVPRAGANEEAYFGSGPNATFEHKQLFAIEQFESMLDAVASARDKFLSEQQMSVFESVFGKPETIDDMLGSQAMLARGFETLTSAVGNAYDAWVSGSMSAAAAFKASIGEALRATGKEMAIEALKATAWGFVYLARKDPSSAALSFKSAAIFGAAAVAAGGAAKAIGSGGAPSGGGSSGGGLAPSLRSGVGGGEDRQETINVYLGDTLAEDNPRRRRNDIARAIHGAHRELERTRGVTYR